MNRSLLVHNPDGTSLLFPLDQSTIKIGRAADNDLVLFDPDRSVSRWHAVMRVGDGQVRVEDLNSSNGTVVNGRIIHGETKLTANDTIKLGQFVLAFSDAAEVVKQVAAEAVGETRFNISPGSLDLGLLQQNAGSIRFLGGGSTAPDLLKNLELLYEVGLTLAHSHSIEEVTASSIGLLFKISQVHRATVLLWDEEKQVFRNSDLHMRNVGKVDAVPQSYDPASLVMSRTILNRVRRENLPLLIRDAKSEATLDAAASVVRAGIQAAFCSPLSFQGKFLGILYADNLAAPDAFSDADFRTFSSIAAQTGLALANAIASQQLLQREAERQALKLYLPPQVADLIVASGGLSQLEGVLQPLTVMYADIRGFTTLSEQMEARELVHMLSEFFTAMSRVIFEHNGTLDKFIGDCIMALFGAPIASDLAARQGMQAAIGMQREMERLNLARLERNQKEFQIGIGLHCGPAVVGNIGSTDRVQYTAIGDTVNVASRLCGRAAPGQIIVSQDIVAAIPGYPGFEPLGEVELKGRSAKLNVFTTRRPDVPLE